MNEEEDQNKGTQPGRSSETGQESSKYSEGNQEPDAKLRQRQVFDCEPAQREYLKEGLPPEPGRVPALTEGI